MRATTRIALLTVLWGACAPTASEARPRLHPLTQQLPAGVTVDLLDAHGESLPTAWRHGRRYVLGETGERYVIRIANATGRRIEVVASVDGLDVIDGKPASFAKRGYVIDPYGEVRIDGWRTSFHSVAAFRFGRVADSYAGRTVGARNVGVIGVAVFTERPEEALQLPLLPGHRYRRHGEVGGRDAHPEANRGVPPAAPGKAKAAPRAGGESAEAEARGRSLLERRPGLGTEFGEQRGSRVRLTSFVREHPTRPSGYAELRYDDQPGLARLGIFFAPAWDDDDAYLRATANPFPAGPGFAAPPPPRWHYDD